VSVRTESWPRPHRLTVDEYYRMAEVGVLPPDARVELIDGAIIDMAPIGSRHGAAVDFLSERFFRALDGAAFVRTQGSVRLSARSEPQPDLAILRKRADRYADSHPTAADILLIVEVSDSTFEYDRNVKAELYARHGIQELWIVDVNDVLVHVLRNPRAGEYAERSIVPPGVMPIPGVTIDVDLTGLLS
jgi:Uma2 family endonuclease